MEAGEQQTIDKRQSSLKGGRTVLFGEAHTKEGLAWGIEVDINISDDLARARFKQSGISIPNNIKNIAYLDLAPQESLSRKLRTIRSNVPPWQSSLNAVASVTPDRPNLEKFLNTFNQMMPQDEKRFSYLADMIAQAANTKDVLQKFNEQLAKSKGDTIVIVHGHSYDLSIMGEQYPDQTLDEAGLVVQRANNAASMKDILNRYNNPNKFSVIVINGCNGEKGSVLADKVPVLYPLSDSKHMGGGWDWDKPGILSIPNASESSI